MTETRDELMVLKRTQMETAVRVSALTLESAERLLQIQMNATKKALDDGARHARTLADVRNLEEFAELQRQYAQPALEEAASYVKDLCEVMATTQSEIGTLITKQATELNQNAIATLHKMLQWTQAETGELIEAASSASGQIVHPYENVNEAARQLADTVSGKTEPATIEVVRRNKKQAA